MSLDSLPSELHYLKPYLEFLSKLDTEDIHEDTDTAVLNEAAHTIAEEYGDDWEAKLNRDMELLESWMEKTSPANDYGYFVSAYLSYFEKGQKTEAEIMKEAKATTSGLCLASPIEGASIADLYGRLSIRWKDQTFFEVAPCEDKETHDHCLKTTRLYNDPKVCQIDDVVIGDWSVVKVVYHQSEPFFWKEASYYLNDGKVYAMGSAGNEKDKDFDLNTIEEVIKHLKVSEG